MVKAYYQLTKPGIVYGNAIAAIAGFFFASRGHVNILLFLAMLIGICLIIASACVFNNYIDREIDTKMERTKKRALANRTISNRNALVYGTILGLIGLFILAMYTNILTAFLAGIGFFFYVVMYGIWKRKSVHGTLVGSISGSIPLVVGYCAVTNSFDIAALLLFLALAIWQMPHFYAIAMYRVEDYAAAGLPVLPVKKGAKETKKQIFWYVIAFIIVAILFTVFKLTGFIYLVVMVITLFFWLQLAIKGLQVTDNKKWGRSMFRFSLIVLLVFCLMLSIGPILP